MFVRRKTTGRLGVNEHLVWIYRLLSYVRDAVGKESPQYMEMEFYLQKIQVVEISKYFLKNLFLLNGIM